MLKSYSFSYVNERQLSIFPYTWLEVGEKNYVRVILFSVFITTEKTIIRLGLAKRVRVDIILLGFRNFPS